MSKEIRSKTLAIFVVLAMVLSTMMVVRFSAPVEAANGGDVSTGIGIDDFEGGYNYTAGDYSYDFVNTSTTQLYYDNTVTIQFNKSVLNNFTAKYGSTYFYLYHPVYTWDSSTDKYNVTWRKWTNPPTNPQGKLSSEGKIENVHLNVSGLWFVCDQLSITKTNFTNASYMKVYNGTSWTNITGWFWVNSTKYYTVEVSPSTIHYDKNETVTITVKHGDETVGGVWCDIIKDNRSGLGGYYVVRHEYMDEG
ncbi:MAG TPA: hypothetical protein ENF43_03715, partial [Thermoplasmatales archaeon]|nr:hypothetical protein [Thermoplasmatales archaeon]